MRISDWSSDVCSSDLAHLCLSRGGRGVCVSLSRAPASSGFLPSVDNMLWSVSEIYGRNGPGIVFSGMGRDGLVGSARLVDSGRTTLVQDSQTSTLWGRPRAVVACGSPPTHRPSTPSSCTLRAPPPGQPDVL